MNEIPLIFIVGRSGAGKTTLIEKLVREFVARGFRVAVIKHHAHATPIDSSGKDSARYSAAGARTVIVSSPVEIATFEQTENELSLAEIKSRVADVDLILVEGFKREPGDKIEVMRAQAGDDFLSREDELVAVASDRPLDLSIPCFRLDDATGIASFVLERYRLGKSRSRPV